MGKVKAVRTTYWARVDFTAYRSSAVINGTRYNDQYLNNHDHKSFLYAFQKDLILKSLHKILKTDKFIHVGPVPVKK